MIITQVIGGLGNQMFQYAAGRALALERNQPLSLDVSGFAGYGLHNGFELERVFDCSVRLASVRDVRGVLGWQSLPAVRRILARSGMQKFRRRSFVVEPHFHYWEQINNIPSDCYLAGYWQSEKYFSRVVSVIAGDFAFKQPLSSRNAEIGAEIGQVNSVSLHIRRGDYASNPKTTANHGLCSLDYYQAALQYVCDRVDSPHFFIFSDDIAWAKAHLKIDFPCQYIGHNQGLESYNDMRLMSLCRHHIIANSSFSWWGAWLNSRPEKIVVAPSRWFLNGNNIKDLFPSGWIAL